MSLAADQSGAEPTMPIDQIIELTQEMEIAGEAPIVPSIEPSSPAVETVPEATETETAVSPDRQGDHGRSPCRHRATPADVAEAASFRHHRPGAPAGHGAQGTGRAGRGHRRRHAGAANSGGSPGPGAEHPPQGQHRQLSDGRHVHRAGDRRHVLIPPEKPNTAIAPPFGGTIFYATLAVFSVTPSRWESTSSSFITSAYLLCMSNKFTLCDSSLRSNTHSSTMEI